MSKAGLIAKLKIIFNDLTGKTADVKATEMGGDIFDEVAGIYTFQKCRCYRNAAQTLAACAWDKIDIDIDDYDPSNISDLVNHRIIPTITGYYQVNGQVYINGTAANDYITCAIYKNGVNNSRGSVCQINSALGARTIISDVIYCNGSTDYIELWAYCNNARALNIVNTSNYLSLVGPF